ncbi:hypothetical protein AVEN_187650-1, partial [Araneus ventricosus]
NVQLKFKLSPSSFVCGSLSS